MPKFHHKFESIIFDIFALAVLYVFATGGAHLIQENWIHVIRQKPWMHRAVMAIISVLPLLWFFLRSSILKSSFCFQAIQKILQREKLFLTVLFFLCFIPWTASSVLRHANFESSFDMAIFVQAIWNTLQGDFLYSSIKGGICLLADHFSPILIIYATLYSFWQSPLMLLTLQALFASVAIFPLFWIVKRETGTSRWAVTFCIAYMLYLPLRNAVRFDFHPEVLALPLIFLTYWQILNRRLFIANILMAIILICKETAALATFSLACYAIFGQKAKTWGAFWAIISIFYIPAVAFLIPRVAQTDYIYMAGNILIWRELGLNQLFSHLVNVSTVTYGIKIFAPIGFLSVLNPAYFLLTLPPIAQNLLSHNELARSIFFQYTIFLTPFVFISGAYGAKQYKNSKIVFYALVFLMTLMSGVSEYYLIYNQFLKSNSSNREIRRMLGEIPVEASVRTHELLSPHLAHRKELHIYENNNPKEGGRAQALSSDYVILDRRILGANYMEHINVLLSQGYTLKHQNGSIYVLLRS